MASANKRKYSIIVFCILLLFMLALWVTVKLLTSRSNELKKSTSIAQTIHWTTTEALAAELSSAAPGLESRLQGRIERLLKNPEILYLELVLSNGTRIASGKKESLRHRSPTDKDTGCEFKDNYVFIWGTMNQPGKKQTHKFLLVLNNIIQSEVIRREGNMLLIILLTGVACITFMILAISLYFRNKKLIEELNLAQKKRDMVEEMSLAAAGLAHETKNPLGIIRGLAQQIAEGSSEPESAREKAKHIIEEADITTARLGDFLAYAKLKKPNLTEFEAQPYFERIGKLMQSDFDDGLIEFNMRVDDIHILADEEMLSQILLNLLTNSLKSTPEEGKIHLFLKKMDKQVASLIISDTGSGIPQEFLPNIFKPYSSKRSGGYGIGMAIVKKIVEESGWEINIKSELDKGTEVEITNIRYRDWKTA